MSETVPVAPDAGADAAGIEVMPGVRIPRTELEYRASRAGGPGGQHVNKTSSRIELLWDVTRTQAVSDDRRARLIERLAGRVNGEGRVRVVASDMRSQLQNRERAEVRLGKLVREALTEQKARKATKPSRSQREERLSAKRHRSERKRDRRPGSDD